MNDGLNPTPKPANRSRTYFITGFVLLLIMAITWSLDDSFVYTSLGAAVFFFFLAFYHRPAQPNHGYQHTTRQYSRQPPQQRQQQQQNDVISQIIEAFKAKGSYSSTRPRSPQQQAERGRKFAMLVMLFIGSIFVFIVLAVLFSDDQTGEEYEENEFYNKAEQARYAGNYDSAEYYYRRALTDDPENVNALNGLGIVSLDLQRYDNAINEFDNALRIDPDFKFARYNKALTLYYQKNYQRSLSETLNLLERAPDYYDAMQLAGDNYYDQQRYDSAKYWYDEGYDSGLRNAWICHVLGYLYDRNNESQRAVELYREALSYDSTKVDVYERLGEMFPGEDGNFYRIKATQLKQSSN